MAHSALDTLNSPVMGTRASMRSPSGPSTVNVEPSGSRATSTARQSASAPAAENVRIGMRATASSWRPCSSSTLVSPLRARALVNSDALASK